MLYIVYLIIAASVVWCSVKASEYLDVIEKRSTLSGAFIGGVVLSAVTSLPELFTSLSSTMLLDKPGLAIGNILGSNLFNYAMLAFMLVFCYRRFAAAQQSKSHVTVAVTVACIYIVMLLNFIGVLKYELLSVNIASIIIIALYIFGVLHMSGEKGTEAVPAQEEELSYAEAKKRFALASIGLVLLSIILTYVTDGIATRLNLGAGFAGALLLGVATSLPEASSTWTLLRLNSFSMAVGNIIGSNLFNFFILALVDVTYIGGNAYDYTDPKTVSLLAFGALANLFFLRLIWRKPVKYRRLVPFLIIACYAAFLYF